MTVNDSNDVFKLPIFYNKHKTKLPSNIVDDLELIKTADPSSNPLYSYYFNNNNEFSNTIINQMSEYYTTDVGFLKDTQTLLQTYKKLNYDDDTSNKYENIINLWNEVKNDTGFKEKYYYVDWKQFEFLNKSERFLQVMSVYNIASPLISLCVPIIILIIPFFVIRVKGLKLDIHEYIDILKVVVSNHAVGKLFSKFSSVSTNEKIYLVVSALFYLFSIYQNVLVCIRFNNNMKKIHLFFTDINDYLTTTICKMKNYIDYSQHLISHSSFNDNLTQNINLLVELKQQIASVTEYKLTNPSKALEFGRVLKLFYDLHDNNSVSNAVLYSFGFNGYIDCIDGLIHNIDNNQINFNTFTTSNKNIIKNNYYGCLKNDAPVKNNIKLNKNFIITGPNASGKTTLLKSVLINIIFTQQYGCGFYDSAKLKPFHHIHSYLNIPDTSGRDSLFQAEARRCKDILDIVKSNPEESHFCIFDELYSGTNPEEAVTSATAFMKYLTNNPNVRCMLTTHFFKLAKNLRHLKQFTNSHMDTTKEGDLIRYNYKLNPGISTVKGCFNVLFDMKFPKEILDSHK